LQAKIEELRKMQPVVESIHTHMYTYIQLTKSNPEYGRQLFPGVKLNELFTLLQENNSSIYVQRWKKLYGGPGGRKKSLFAWKLTNVEIKALADDSYTGEENFTRNLLSMNPSDERCGKFDLKPVLTRKSVF